MAELRGNEACQGNRPKSLASRLIGRFNDYDTRDFFDKYDDDLWDLVEGEHFEFVQSTGGLKSRTAFY